MIDRLKNNWFLIALVLITAVTVLDSSGISVAPGLWLKNHHGPDIIIFLIFFLSGLALKSEQVVGGLTDYKGTITALFLIFIAAPIISLLFLLPPLPTGVLIGIFLVAVMPTTLSSGVVMTDTAGGNMAHALFITIIANSLAVLTIPATISLLLNNMGDNRVVNIEQVPIMIKIATLVLLPLVLGMAARRLNQRIVQPLLPYTSILNQTGILMVVWMATCKGRATISLSFDALLVISAATFVFHLILLIAGFTAAKLLQIPKGKRESVVLMGAQKTLPLSLILQVSLFPEYGEALVVCVVHHIIHLGMDAFLAVRMRESGQQEASL